MTPRLIGGSTPLDDFLDDSGSATETGELLQRIGLFGSLFGITLAAGLIVFLGMVHRGSRREVGIVLRIVALAGGVTLVGAAVELAGDAEIANLDWTTALTDGSGAAPMMRLLAGLMIALGLFEQTLPVGTERADETAGADAAGEGGDVRWFPGAASAFGLAGAAVGVISFWFDGHTVTLGPRVVHAVADTAHVSAGSVWFGGVVGLTVVAVLRRSAGPSIAPLLIRFSSIATVALIVVALAGSLMTLMIVDGLGDLTGTEWGRLLLVKVAAVAVTAGIGGYNHFIVVPALDATESVGAMERRARATVAVESVLLVFVTTVTVFLTTASVN